MARKRNKSTLVTNLDVNLTPQQRLERAKDDYNDGVIQDAVDRAKREGPKPEAIVAGQNYYTTYDRLAETQAFASGDKPSLIPLAYEIGPQHPGGFHWVLSDADYDAVMAGVYCYYCLVRHDEIWAPACKCCGADRDMLN